VTATASTSVTAPTTAHTRFHLMLAFLFSAVVSPSASFRPTTSGGAADLTEWAGKGP
jgi:hypothetical protein